MRENFNQADLIERDYAKQPLTAAEVEAIFGDDDVAPFLNTRHAVYKARDFAAKLPPRDELIQLIIAEPNLLRRPIVRQGKKVVIGFKQTEIKKLAS